MAKYLDESGVGILWGKVKDLVSDSVGGVTQFDYEIVSTLPAVKDAVKGKYYLVANTENGDNQYDEFLLIGDRFEKVGPKAIDISGKQDSLSPTQLDACNSGITSDKVSTYDGLVTSKQDTLTQEQLSAVDSGITSTKVSGYDTHIADANIHVTGTEKSTWNGKQDALSADQLSACNSGITSTKVSTYDGYASLIAGKQDKLSVDQLAACNSGITSTKVNTYDGYASLIAGKQDSMTAITEGELDTICS